jgi:thioredoxin/glutathione reductase (selenoprotein)
VCAYYTKILLSKALRISIAVLTVSKFNCIGFAAKIFRKMSTTINIAGYKSCGDFELAKTCARGLNAICPEKYSACIQEFENRDEYLSELPKIRAKLGIHEHNGSPIVWLNDAQYIGGENQLLAWSRRILGEPAKSISPMIPDDYNPAHSYDYDLIVIGGGSGGLACSKQAQKYGARVAVIDYVKPSPHGSTWGLGGTCVNVGCIPKKLMHTAALLGEASHEAPAFGWMRSGHESPHNWQTLRDNVQDHIKGLNFNYRVQLREEGVTYINKLARFVDAHTLEVMDKKGKKDTITSARFVVAVGGRPTLLECPGGEFAITSDDIFMKDTPPGKTCVIGAGYVALECAGFINGLNQGGVTVLVRSIPLRGFDRDMAGRVIDHMKSQGINVAEGVLPKSITKTASGRYLVEFSNNTPSEEFDTVLCAVGRRADTDGLNLDAAGILTNKGNGKIIGINEQTNIPHIYAIGDVLDATPELTPVAILAGKLLAGRLFGGKTEIMDYPSHPTTIFTPLEYGCVGLSEEAAIAKYGADAVDCLISGFHPLEWSLNESRHAGVFCYAKVVFDKSTPANRVLGLHIAAPNAGEIMQGYSCAFRKGLTLQDLSSTIGIHPTTAEEFTTLTTLKSSGESAAKSGC